MRFPPSATPRHHANPIRSEPMTKAATASLASAAANLPLRSTDLVHLETLHRRLLWLSCWTIHHANHLRDKGKCEGEVKVEPSGLFGLGGRNPHGALFPRASLRGSGVGQVSYRTDVSRDPVSDGRQTRARLMALRGYGGVQSIRHAPRT